MAGKNTITCNLSNFSGGFLFFPFLLHDITYKSEFTNQYYFIFHAYNVNLGSNSGFYINNSPGSANIQYDGFTTVLQAQALGLSPGNHTIKLAIADVSDSVYDSAVFVQGSTFSTTPTPPNSQQVPEPFTIVGTLIGATVAFRTRQRLKATNKL